MKNFIRIFCFLALTGFSATLFAQGPVVKLNYMKVNPGMWDAYWDVEQQWKKIHQKKVELGICTGWQLWRKLYNGTEDAYDYIAIDWYDDYPSSFETYPDDFIDGLMTQEEVDKLMEMTTKSRDMVRQEMSYRIHVADDPEASSKYLVVTRMKVKEGKGKAYREMEEKIWKPLQEAAIEKGYMSHWGVWGIWPLQEGQAQYVVVDGYESPEQMVGGEDLLPEVHPDMTWDEIIEKTSKTRYTQSVEMWELVESVFPEE